MKKICLMVLALSMGASLLGAPEVSDVLGGPSARPSRVNAPAAGDHLNAGLGENDAPIDGDRSGARPSKIPGLFDHPFVAPSSIAQIAGMAEEVKLAVCYTKADEETAFRFDLKDVLKAGEGFWRLPLRVCDGSGDKRCVIEDCRVSHGDLDTSSFKGLKNSLDTLLRPYLDAWIVSDDQGNPVPAQLEFGLQLRNVSKKLPPYLKFDDIHRLSVCSADCHGLDSWYFPDLKEVRLNRFSLPKKDVQLAAPVAPLCILRSHILAEETPGALILRCFSSIALPLEFYPYLSNDRSPIKMRFSPGQTYYFEHSCGFLGASDLSCAAQIPHNPIAYFGRAHNPWHIREDDFRPFSFKWTVDGARTPKRRQGVKPIMTVLEGGGIECVDGQMILPPEIVAHVLKFIPFWERFALGSIIPALRDHVWRLGCEVPIKSSGDVVHNALSQVHVGGRVETNVLLTHTIPGRYQMPEKERLKELNTQDAAHFFEAIGSTNVSHVKECLTCHPIKPLKRENFEIHLANIARQPLDGGDAWSLRIDPSQPFGLKGVAVKQEKALKSDYPLLHPSGEIRWQRGDHELTEAARIVKNMAYAVDFLVFDWEYKFLNGLTLSVGPVCMKISQTAEETERYTRYGTLFDDTEEAHSALGGLIFQQIAQIFNDHQKRLRQEKEAADRADIDQPDSQQIAFLEALD